LSQLKSHLLGNKSERISLSGILYIKNYANQLHYFTANTHPMRLEMGRIAKQKAVFQTHTIVHTRH